MFACVFAVDPSQVGKGITLISVMDVNDNAPVFAIEYETFLCESARPGQVPYYNDLLLSCCAFFSFSSDLS